MNTVVWVAFLAAFAARGELACTEKEEDVVSLLQNQLTAQSPAEHMRHILGDLLTPLDKNLEMLAKNIARRSSTSGRSRSELEKELVEGIKKMSEQQKGHLRKAMVQEYSNSKREEPQCITALGANAAYSNSKNGILTDAIGSRTALGELGWDYERSFNSSANSGWDHMGWYRNGGKCMFTFQGSDDDNDFINNYNHALGSVYGVNGIHTGVTNELEPLVDKWYAAIDEIQGKCTEPILITGHSLGGGLAQVFALVLTSADSTLSHTLTVGGVYTFGAMSVGETNAGNDAGSGTTCFPGFQYWNARIASDGSGNTEVDILRSVYTGGNLLEPIQSDKKLLFGPGADSHQTYACGQTIPKVFGGSGYDLHLLPQYEFNLECITPDEFGAALARIYAIYGMR